MTVDSASLSIRQGASASMDPVVAARELYASIHQPDIGLAIFYCSDQYDLEALGSELRRLFGSVNLIGCTTAGEISPLGYLSGSLAGVSLASPELRVATSRLEGVRSFGLSDGESTAAGLRVEIGRRGRRCSGANTFGFLLIDGLCNHEEAVISTLSRSLGDIPLFGGSAGDGTRFERTLVFHEGAFHEDVAVFTLVQTAQPFTVFKTQHFESASEKIVVTEADPARRIVTEINGEPAGREFARVVGLDVEELTPMIFATHPVVVRIGGDDYVRSIQKVNADGSLSFFCAIDEGVVLTVARGVDLVASLERAFDEVRQKIGPPALVLGCDCILRRLEIEQRELGPRVSEIMKENQVVGFCTYGEQFNSMHVNQTFTGVAIGAERRG